MTPAPGPSVAADPTPTPRGGGLAACLARWQLEPDPGSLGLLPATKNANLLCRDARGDRVLVKQSAVPGSLDIRNEGQAIQALTALVAVNAAPLALPRIRGFDADAGLLALAWVPDAPTLYHAFLATGRVPAASASGIAQGLGWLHATSHAQPEALPPALRDNHDTYFLQALVYLRPEFYARLSRDGQEFYATLQADSDAFTVLYELLNENVAHCMLHGDMKTVNLILPRGAAGRPVFLDWELAAWGDPARDVGAIVASCAILNLAPPVGSPWPAGDLRAFLRRLMASYRRARGRRFPLEADFSLRVARWAGASLLWYAFGLSHFDGRLGPNGHALVGHGRQMLVNPHRWAWDLWSDLP